MGNLERRLAKPGADPRRNPFPEDTSFDFGFADKGASVNFFRGNPRLAETTA